MEICDYCRKSFATIYTLTRHQKTARLCLKLQDTEVPEVYSCSYCKYQSPISYNVKVHQKRCKEKKITECQEKAKYYKKKSLGQK